MAAPIEHHGFARTTPPRLVGREREQGMLRDHLAAALAGQGGLVLIGGEAGIGKTVLADALCTDAMEQDARVLIGRCYDLTETPPYGPWIELFGRYEQGDGMPPLPRAFAQHGTVGAVSGQGSFFQEVEDFLTALSARQPLVLLLDDLHWADPASLDLLRFLARTLASLPILIVVAYRVDELTRRHPLYALLPAFVREAHAARLDLRPLDGDALRAMIEARYRLSAAEVSRLIAYLHERTEGNPFFLGELLRTLEEEGILRASDGVWGLSDLTRARRVPALLRQVIDSRLARLGEEAQHLLGIAAVIGPEVPVALWAAMADADEEQLLPCIERTIEAQIVTETPDGAGVRFVHALIREALYEGILGTRRRLQHRRIGEALAALPDADPDAVAYHFRQGGDARAAEWLVKAGTRARLAYAFVTAAERYEAAIALMESDPTASSEYGWAAYLLANAFFFTAPRRAVDILSTVVAEAVRRGDTALEALARYQRALIEWSYDVFLGPADDMAAAVRTLEALPATETQRIRHYVGPRYSLDDDRAGLARILYITGRFAEALRLAEGLAHGEHDTQAYPYATGAETLGIVYATRGQLDEARRWLRRGHDGLRACRMLAPRIHLIVYDLLFVYLAYDADKPEAGAALLREAEEIEAEAHDSGLIDFHASAMVALHILHGAWPATQVQLEVLSTSLNLSLHVYLTPHLAFLAWQQGDHEKVAQFVAAMLPNGPATSPGSVRFHPALPMQRIAVACALDMGDLPTAKAWLDAHDRWLAWGSAVLGQSEGQALWAQYYRATGDTQRARVHADRALALASAPRQPLALLAAHRLLGELDIAAGRLLDAADHLGQALRLADACDAPYERALTLLSLAELQAAADKRLEALRLLDTVRAICTPLGAQRALVRADVLAARLAARKSLAPTYPDGLSVREVDVLRLIATGINNQEIADTLSLSVRTVERHITNLYGKIGARGRADATTYALQHLT